MLKIASPIITRTTPVRYGVPCQGSKNRFAVEIVECLPPATHFYDIFAGGCAIAHAAALSGKYKLVHVSDICDLIFLFKDALQGKFRDEYRWICREDFFKLKDTDRFVQYCWSFNYNRREYMYGRHIEPYKKAYHFACLGDFSLFDEFYRLPRLKERLELSRHIKKHSAEIWDAFLKYAGLTGEAEPSFGFRKMGRLQSLENLGRLQSLENLERLQSLKNLERLQQIKTKITFRMCDYREVDFEPDSVVYADPPYANVTGYHRQKKFNSEEFWEWARNLSC